MHHGKGTDPRAPCCKRSPIRRLNQPWMPWWQPRSEQHTRQGPAAAPVAALSWLVHFVSVARPCNFTYPIEVHIDSIVIFNRNPSLNTCIDLVLNEYWINAVLSIDINASIDRFSSILTPLKSILIQYFDKSIESMPKSIEVINTSIEPIFPTVAPPTKSREQSCLHRALASPRIDRRAWLVHHVR